jgi:hypothetical protein
MGSELGPITKGEFVQATETSQLVLKKNPSRPIKQLWIGA